MGLRKILTNEDPALHKVCKPVEKFDWRLHKLLDDMQETLIESNGVGLAAPQVGILRRVVLVDLGDEILELINPEIIGTDGEQVGAEGCLSVPGIHEDVSRPESVVVKYLDRNFEEHTEELTGMLARVAQHEIDHLIGKVFVDRLSNIRKTLLKRKLGDVAAGRMRTHYRMRYSTKK